MALRWPKLGELVAFRKVIDTIPSNTSTDEVALEALISAKGFRLVYAPDAVVYNRGPQTFPDFILQRRRIFAGHLHIASTLGYVTASLHPGHLMLLALEAFAFYSFLLPLMTGVVAMELWARFLGTLDFLLKTSHHIWRPIRSTKQVSPTEQLLTVLILHCEPESVNPVTLVRNMHRIPTAEGVIFWWSQKRNHILFMVPVSDLAGEELERRVRVLGQYVNPPGTTPGSTVVGYDVVQFARVTSTQFQPIP
jgi:hypothetical protein